jgi:hypothetical protein
VKRTVIFGSVMALVLALGLVAASAKANFTGTWNLDKARSEGLPAAVKEQVLTVSQTDDKLSIESKLTTDQGDQNNSDVYVLDGKPADFTSKGPGGVEGKGKRTAKWTADGNGIDVSEDIVYDTPQGEVTVNITRKWTLSADGKTLTIDMTVNGPMGTQQIKRVMAKKA